MPAIEPPSRFFADTLPLPRHDRQPPRHGRPVRSYHGSHLYRQLRSHVIERIEAVPLPIYGAALALLGAHLLVAIVWPVLGHHPLVMACRLAGTLACLGALAVHLLKLVLVPEAMLRDLTQPGVGLFAGQIGVATSLMCEAYGHGDASRGSQLYGGSLVLAVLALAHIGWSGVGRRAGWRDASPSWLLPGIQWTYLGLLSVPHLPEARAPALALGAALMTVAMVALGLRALRGPPWPAPARPALAIGIVPPALGLMAALQLGAGVAGGALLFTWTLLSFGAALMAVVITPPPMRVSWWAYGMPVSAAAIAFHIYSQALSHAPPTGVSMWLTGLAQGAALVALGLTAWLSVSGLRSAWRFCMPTSPTS